MSRILITSCIHYRILPHLFLLMASIRLAASNISFSTRSDSSNSFTVSRAHSMGKMELKSYALIYEDTSGIIPFEDIRHKIFTELTESAPSERSNVYWVHLTINSDLDYPSDWRLKLFKYWCEEVTVYSQSVAPNLSDWTLQKAGYCTSIDQLDVREDHLSPFRSTPDAVTLHLEPGERKEIFIRYKRVMRPALIIDPVLQSISSAAHDLLEYDNRSYYTSILIGMFLILGIYHFCIYLFEHDRAYLYYSLYSTSLVFSSVVMDEYENYIYLMFFKHIPHLQPWVFLYAGCVSIVLYVLFSRSYLRTKKRLPLMDKVLLAIIGQSILILAITTTNFIITGRQYLHGLPFEGFIFLIALGYIILCYRIWRKREPTDTFYLLGAGLTLIIIVPKYFGSFTNINVNDLIIGSSLPVDLLHFGLLTELIFFALGLGYRTRITLSEKRRIEEIDQLKTNFFINISHEFRTPLTLISGPLQRIKTKLADKEDLTLVEMAQKNVDLLIKLVNQILDLSKIEANKLELKTSISDVLPLIRGSLYSFESAAEKRGITLECHSSSDSLFIAFDKDKMETILLNLFSNALKFSRPDEKITVIVEEVAKEIAITITDRGSGISDKDLPYIFDRYYQAVYKSYDDQIGTGIGLSLVRELVRLHGGRIEVKSTENVGTSFLLYFPKSETKPQLDAITASEMEVLPMDEEMILSLNPDDQETTLSDNDMSHILIIEDNSHVRYLIKAQLNGLYRISEAEDGDTGISKAIEEIPDLILCDIMMPVKNGYDVCKTLKSDISTSHIPIILLTAKTGMEEKIEGLESGADDYIFKPFNSTEVSVRIKNLLESRKTLRLRFSTSISIKPSEVSANSIDQEFIKRALEVVELHMGDEDFNVDTLSREMNISRTQLNTKLRSLIDQSTNQFIQSVRLQRASDMIMNHTGTISEIAYATGFRSAAYFTATFRNHFGQTPGEFKRNNQAANSTPDEVMRD